VLIAGLLPFSSFSLAQNSSSTLNATATATAPANAATIIRDMQAITMLQQALAALGGTGGAPSSITASGTYTKYAGDGSTTAYPIRLEALGNDKFRREIDLSDGTHVVIVRGASGWTVSPQATDGLSLAQRAGNNLEDLPVLALAQWLSSTNVGLRAVGAETVAGTSVFHITVQPTALANASAHLEKVYEETSRCEIFLDPQTSLPVRIRYYVHPTDWRVAIPVDLDLSNFQSIQGVLFPSTISRYINGRKLSTTEYQAITLNVSLSDADFSAEVTQ
jgi:hypothetical protein